MKNKRPKQNNWFFYVLECSDNTFYAGITTDLHRRLQEHNRGKGAKYTRGRTPVKLLFQKSYPDRSRASKAENEFKKMSREKKAKKLKAGR